MSPFPAAPPWQIQTWFNTPRALQPEDLRGKVVVLEAFQMLCPGCVSHGLPQAARIHQLFAREEVAVVGIHTVFEHHAAMTPVSLEAFLYEYGIPFPVGVDAPSPDSPIPRTMQAYGMRGTPSLVLIDAQGRIRHHHFGKVDDLLLGAQIATLARSAVASVDSDGRHGPQQPAGCAGDGCETPQ